MPGVIELAHNKAIEIEEHHVHGVEHVLFHPTRCSVVSITTQSLEEIDPQYGSTIGETAFDLQFLSDKPSAGASARQLEHVVAVGSHHVAAIFQSRNLVVWDLRDAVLQSVTEVEKQQKSVAALAASLCKDKWLFYASEGSNSIKVSAVDSKDPPKKISRKATNRSSQLTALAYHTPRRLLCAGASDGALSLWVFSEENALGSAKEEAAIVTPFFNALTTQAPVVKLSFVSCGQSSNLLVVAYQNRVVEVWDLAPVSSSSRPREPYRVAVLHCLPPQATDYALKNGELSFVLHPLAPILTIHWHAYHGAGSCATTAELRLGYGATPTSVTLSDWHEFLPAAPPSHEDGNAVLLFGAGNSAPSPFMAYMSAHHHRQLLPLNVASPQLATIVEETTKLTLSTSFQLSVEQYFKYQDVPSAVLQVSRNPEGTAGQTLAFQLQRYSQISGEVEKLDDLAVWNNYQGRQLLPWKLRSNEQQSALCVQLQDSSKAIANEDDGGFSYVLLEVKAKPKGSGDADGGEGGGSAVNVTCGTPMDALDVCFCDFRSEEAKQNRPFVLLVLASSGKSIGFQMHCNQVDQNIRVLLHQPVQRLFPTPIALSPSSPHAELVGSRMLYLLADSSSGKQTLVFSEDDLAVPRNTAVGSFTTRGDGERVLDVVWNSGAASTNVSAPSDSAAKLVVVWTTQRLVVLSASMSSSFASLSYVAEYDLETDLGSPQSVLWVAQSLLFVTRDQQLRFATPLRTQQQPHSPRSHLLCSLATDASAPFKIQLVSLCGDRLCYTATDPRSLECRTFLRPIAVCEPLLLGFTDASDGRLKAIFERDFLVFLLSGGQETRSPVTDKLLELMHHDFGWTETTTKLLDALLNPSTAAASVAAATSGGGNAGGNGGSYKKLSHLSPATVASLMLHAHKWRDAVRVFLSSDPALEEYALAEDDAASAAKLPSRTGKTAQLFTRLAVVLASVGQAELAIKCLDVAGDDLGILDLLKRQGLDQDGSQSLLNALQKDWNKLHPPLTAITKAIGPETVPESAILRRHDLFSLLCCEHLSQTERRSRLLSSVRPLDKLTMSVQKTEPKTTTASAPGRAGISYWKRLSPEDTKDTIGTSMTPHFSADEPKNPTNYSLFSSSGGLSSLIGGLSLGGTNDDPSSAADPAAQSTNSNDASAKMTIGPFLEDEDAVVAYWRFEEGSTAPEDDLKRTLESMDTTKRENHLQVLNFASLMTFATSTAPVDKGEDGKLQEAFSLRFPSASVAESEASTPEDWGAKCAVRPGSTLDIGFVFDDDPYRRKLTFEAWIRNFVLFRKQQEAQENDENAGDDFGSGGGAGESQLKDDASMRRLVSRRGFDKSTWWEFGLCDGGYLFLTFSGHTIKSEDAIANAAAWQHVAFSIDISSPKSATLKLFLQARCVATKEIGNVDANAKPLVSAATKALAGVDSSGSDALPPPLSTMHVGFELTDYEMTELRVWATARTPEQLSDMKENYLGIAEAKRRMKIAIHQRNCQCEKCLGRRTNKTQVGKVALLGTPLFPSTPPSSAASARDRRRPQPKA